MSEQRSPLALNDPFLVLLLSRSLYCVSVSHKTPVKEKYSQTRSAEAKCFVFIFCISSRTGVSESQTGVKKSQTGGSESKTGISEGQIGVSKSQTGVSESQTEVIESQTGVSESQTGESQTGVSESQSVSKSVIQSVSTVRNLPFNLAVFPLV